MIYRKRAIAIKTPIMKVNPITPKMNPTIIAINSANGIDFSGIGYVLDFAIISNSFYYINIFGGFQ